MNDMPQELKPQDTSDNKTSVFNSQAELVRQQHQIDFLLVQLQYIYQRMGMQFVTPDAVQPQPSNQGGMNTGISSSKTSFL
jgi:hypothetical protein